MKIRLIACFVSSFPKRLNLYLYIHLYIFLTIFNTKIFNISIIFLTLFLYSFYWFWRNKTYLLTYLLTYLEKFSEYCNPRKIITILCHKYFIYQQYEGQNVHDFVTELKKLRSEYEFDTLHYSLIKVMLVCGNNDNSWENVFFVNLNWLFPKQYRLVMLPKRLVNMPAKFLSKIRPSIWTRFQNTQNLEVKPPLKLRR